MSELHDEYQSDKKRELLETPIIHGNAGDVIRGRFVAVTEKDGVEYVRIDPNNGYPEVAVESPGFKDLFQRSDAEIQETFALENNLLYFTDADIRVEALAVLHSNGRIVWHVEPLIDKKFSLPIPGSELAETYKKEIIPELKKDKEAVQQIRRSLGLIEVDGDSSREFRYPRTKTPFEILQEAKDYVGGKQYQNARKNLARTEKEDRKLNKEIDRLEALAEHQTNQDKAIPPQLEKDLEALKATRSKNSNEHNAAKAEYLYYSKQLEKEDVKERVKKKYKEVFRAEQVLLVRRERADKHFTQALNRLRIAESLQRDYRALGEKPVEVERSANGLILPANRREIEKQLYPERTKKIEPVKEQVGLQR